MAGNPLSQDAIKALLTSQPKAKGPITEPRTIATFYQLNHILDESGCSNPNCNDPRDRNDVGRKIMVSIATSQGEEHICRYCFLEGYLSVSNG